MFDWLRDLIKEFWTDVKLFTTLNVDERGVRLRGGKPDRSGIKLFKWKFFVVKGDVLGPGIIWKLPFIDEIRYTPVTPTTIDLSEQTVTTANNTQLVIEASVKYEVNDVVKYLCEVTSATDALADMAKGIIRRTASASNWPETNSEDFERLVNRRVKAEAKKWGLEVHDLVIVSLAPMRSIRLLNTNNYKVTEKKD